MCSNLQALDSISVFVVNGEHVHEEPLGQPMPPDDSRARGAHRP
jgi:hypothetical protein